MVTCLFLKLHAVAYRSIELTDNTVTFSVDAILFIAFIYSIRLLCDFRNEIKTKILTLPTPRRAVSTDCLICAVNDVIPFFLLSLNAGVNNKEKVFY